MERDRLVRLNWRLGMVAGITLLLGPVLRFLLSYTGAIIYKDPSKVLVVTVTFSLLLTFFKILMIALGTFMLIYFEEDQQLRKATFYFIYHWWRAGLSFSDRVDRRISNH